MFISLTNLLVQKDQICAVVPAQIKAIKDLVDEQWQAHLVVDVTSSKKRQSVIILANHTLICSAETVEELTQQLCGTDTSLWIHSPTTTTTIPGESVHE